MDGRHLEFPWKDGEWRATGLIDESFASLSGLQTYYVQLHNRALTFLQQLPEGGGSNLYATHMGSLSVDAMILYAVDEEIHHRAQLARYLRALGIRPPAFAQRYQELVDTHEVTPKVDPLIM